MGRNETKENSPNGKLSERMRQCQCEHAIRVSGENLTRKEQRRQHKAIFRDFHHIWQAKRLATVLQRYRHVVRHDRLTQPEAVHCLRTDFRVTVAYFAVHERHPDWDMTHLRTTSRLERFNRCLRRRARAVSAYQSDAGLRALVTQEVAAFNPVKRHVWNSTKEDNVLICTIIATCYNMA